VRLVSSSKFVVFQVLCNVPNIFTGGPGEMFPDLFNCTGAGAGVEYPPELVSLAMQAWVEYVGQLVDVEAVSDYDRCRRTAADAAARGNVDQMFPEMSEMSFFDALRRDAVVGTAREAEVAIPVSNSMERWQLHRCDDCTGRLLILHACSCGCVSGGVALA
jgi:hypothetical protein